MRQTREIIEYVFKRLNLSPSRKLYSAIWESTYRYSDLRIVYSFIHSNHLELNNARVMKIAGIYMSKLDSLTSNFSIGDIDDFS